MLSFIKYLYRLYQQEAKWKKIQMKYPDAKIHPGAKVTPGVHLSKHVQIDAGVVLRGNIKVGRGSFINGPSRLSAGEGVHIEIGNFCSIAAYTCFFASNHPVHKLSSFSTANGFYAPVFSENKGKRSGIKIGSDVCKQHWQLMSSVPTYRASGIAYLGFSMPEKISLKSLARWSLSNLLSIINHLKNKRINPFSEFFY